MADNGVWKLQDDGYLNIEGNPESVIYHPNLNILIVLSRDAESIVVDINSGSVLRKCAFSEESQPIVKGTYLPSYDKVLLTDTKAVGVRSDYNGVLLLDTMLQTCLKSKNNVVKLEMLVSEVKNL
uniref:Baculoviral IAP repeat-containing protein 6 n=1 Tax=Cacopsylla melanoneura TaxID=428564 RepID=A0A8D8SUB1_9HEMI